MQFINFTKNNTATTLAFDDYADEKLCECKINISDAEWIISSWYTSDGHKHNGYGKQTMKACLSYIRARFKLPDRIKYVWNGANGYVLDWLKDNFDAICDCPIAVQKNAFDDDWSSHIYTLNKDKFMKYFEIDKMSED